MSKFKETAKQKEANKVIGSDAKHCLLFGGSRSGKTFKLIRSIIIRALASEDSRHAVLRFRFNHVKASIVKDTYPKVMRTCFPELSADNVDKTDWYAEFPNKSQIWFGGLDDKERTEKILGQEYATMYLNECSQIPYSSRNLAMTRLAQKVTHNVGGDNIPLRLKMYYDCNPPSQSHWTYQLFVKKRDPDTKEALKNPQDYASMVMNPEDNRENLPQEYFDTLDSLPARMRIRFKDGIFAPVAEDALWSIEDIEKWRVLGDLPDMQRIVISVDPSGSGDDDNDTNDPIGIVAAGLGVDGNGYLLEDLTVLAGPFTWGNVATTAYDRHRADAVIGESNFGGAMVEHVIQTARKRTPYRKVTASRGKVVRAEPVSALAEQGRIRHAGYFPELEDELCLVAGTMIDTPGGSVPIEKISAGDFVWTRNGARKVLVARKTRDSVDTVRVVTESGKSIEGTKNHLVFLHGIGYTQLSEITPGMEIIACGKRLDSTDQCTTEIVRPATIIAQRLTRASMSLFGNTRMATTQFLAGILSIIEMAIRLTTPFPICYALQSASTGQYIDKSGTSEFAKNVARYFILMGPERTNIVQLNVETRRSIGGFHALVRNLFVLFAERLLDNRNLLKNEKHALVSACGSLEGNLRQKGNLSALSAGRHLKKSSLSGHCQNYAMLARNQSALEKNRCAQFAGNDFILEGISRKLVLDRVVECSCLKEKKSVYNLKVEGEHEYFANGILTHNCDFTTRGYMGDRSPNRADAYVWAFTDLFGAIVNGPPETHTYKIPQLSSAYAL